jgi:cytoskeleton protein RodZ
MIDTSIGTTLRAAREAKQLSVQDVADKLKIRPSLVEALETERFSDLPEPIYTRAYLERYAQIVGVDAVSLVTTYDRRAGFQTAVTSVPKPTTAASSTMRFAVPPFVFVLAGAALAAGGFWVWNTQFNRPAARPQPPIERIARDIGNRGTNNTLNAPSQGDPSALITVNLSVSSTPSGAAVLLDRFKIGVTPLKNAPVSGGRNRELRLERQGYKPFVQSIELTQNRNFSVNLEKLPATPVTPPAATTPTDGNITLRFRGRSWIRVTNGNNRVLFEGIPEAGSTQAFQGPITLRAGRPDVISASFNGTTRDPLGGANAATIRLP